MSKAIECLRTVVLGQGGEIPDGQLLESFLYRHDQAAFEAVLHRHAEMVFAVCRRVLNHTQDAEDAFQATFLVLVQKARSLLGRTTVGDWLYGVAYHTALKARAQAGKRRLKERTAVSMSVEQLAEPSWQYVEPWVDCELSRLPDKYRAPVVLCDLEGKTRRQAADQLGWPEGTVAGRLARAREILARRLERRGVVVSSAVLGTLLLEHAASAAVPHGLAVMTGKAAALVAAGQTAAAISPQVATLVKGVTKMMLFAKIKTATVVLLTLGVLGAGGAMVSMQASTTEDEGVPAATAAGDQQQLSLLQYYNRQPKDDGQKNQKNDGQKSLRQLKRSLVLADDPKKGDKKNDPKESAEEKVPLDKLPKAVTDAVKARFPEAKLVSAEKEKEDGKTVYEVNIKNKDQQIEVTVTPEGKLVTIEKVITARDLPNPVADVVARKYPKATYKMIEEVIKVDGKDEKLEYYEVLLVTAEKKVLEVSVTPEGTIKKEEKKGEAKEDKK
jgi:RNA polymerase sigma factor (sigma-70 family)